MHLLVLGHYLCLLTYLFAAGARKLSLTKRHLAWNFGILRFLIGLEVPLEVLEAFRGLVTFLAALGLSNLAIFASLAHR